MDLIQTNIEKTIFNQVPEEILDLIFDDKIITIEDITEQILLECCKYAYDHSQPQKSLRQHLLSGDMYTDDVRLTYQRTYEKIKNYRLDEYRTRKEQTGIEISGLLPLSMDTIDEKKSGYQFTDFQFWELKNVHDMWLVDHIISGRISKKNFTKKEFLRDSEQYEKILVELFNKSKSTNYDEKTFSMLAMFTIAWKYSFDYYYEIVCEMEKENVPLTADIIRRIHLLCGPVGFPSSFFMPSSIIHTDSRMVILRKKFIPYLVTSQGPFFPYASIVFTLETVFSVIHGLHVYGQPIREWFIHNTSFEDWGFFFCEHDIFQVFDQSKEWTPKRIRLIKEIYAKLKNPENRS